MRQITAHQLDPTIRDYNAMPIIALDDKGIAGAHHTYVIATSAYPQADGMINFTNELAFIEFQNGNIQESGINGIHNEHLLAIVQDRLECFQQGEFKSDFNAGALEHVKLAMAALHARTTERINRGVKRRNEQ